MKVAAQPAATMSRLNVLRSGWLRGGSGSEADPVNQGAV